MDGIIGGRYPEPVLPQPQCAGISLIESRKHSHAIAVRPARNFAIVLVSAPDLKTARLIANTVLTARLAACANLLPKLESHYWWQGKLEHSNEVLILFKTTRSKLGALEKLVLARHPYDTPEFIAIPLDSGTPRYLDWIASM
jgi:periplasmic divalent cation tolerance protein